MPRLSYPEVFQRWLDTTNIAIESFSRWVTNLFAFSAIEATESFIHFQGKANIVVTDRVYHRLFGLCTGEHSMR
jgi:hypothetical protein